MTPSKLGFLPSSVLAIAVILAPVQAVAAPPEEETVEVGAPEGEAGGVEVGSPEGEAPAEGEPPAEGVTPVEIEPPAEGETPAEGEEVETPEGEGEEATEEGEGEEGEGEEEEPAAEEPPSLEEAGPMRPPEPTWGPKNQYPRNGKGMLITGGIVTGLGAAFIVTSVLVTRCDFDSSLSCKYGDQRDFLVPTAVATTGLGLLLIGVGVSNHVKYKKWQNWTPEATAVVPSYVPGGGGIAWVGRF